MKKGAINTKNFEKFWILTFGDLSFFYKEDPGTIKIPGSGPETTYFYLHQNSFVENCKKSQGEGGKGDVFSSPFSPFPLWGKFEQQYEDTLSTTNLHWLQLYG